MKRVERRWRQGWKNRGVLLLSPFCDFLRLDYDFSLEPLFLVQEIDALRVYSRFHHDLIRAVSTVSTFEG